MVREEDARVAREDDARARRGGATGAASRCGCGAAGGGAGSRPVIDGDGQGDMTLFHRPSTRGRGNRALLAWLCIGSLLLMGLVVVAGRLLMPGAMATDFSAKMLAPSWSHPFGTDQMGRDMFARTCAGLSISLFVGLLASLATGALALALAMIAACGGRAADAVVSWLIDLVMGVPHIVLLLLISYSLGRGFWGVAVGVSLTHWPGLARVLRAELMQAKCEPYLKVSAALGVSRWRRAARHLLPAVVPQLIVGMVLSFPHAILHEASITFLGFGLSPDVPAIGVILAESMGYLTAGAWWLALLPGLVLIGCVLLFDVMGSSLRRLVDARTSQE